MPPPSPPPPAGPSIDTTGAATPDVTPGPPVGDSVLVGDPPTRVPGPLSAPPGAWTVRDVRVERSARGAAVHRAFRAAAHDEFDRLVFAFDGEALPGYRVAYVDRPAHACGSGEAIYLDGEGWLEVSFSTAQAHDDEGRPTLEGPRRRALGLPLALEAALTCDFEGEVTWVVGLRSPEPFRVQELGDPPRLVVDVRR